ncbi:MAG: hypothetical protein D6800_10715 [Candidatus Zixiibacteriota bacterium]|nr:MAG: hypothetical protein D6800_10715 [candidate division Zixibacteria bacterium]
MAPQANVMAVVVQGVMNANLPWEPIIVGGVIALGIELLGVGSLPVAIGLYLPLSLSTPIMAGGLVALFVKKRSTRQQYNERNLRGILFSSGMVAGDALIGVIVALMIMSWGAYQRFYDAHEGALHTLTGGHGPLIALIAFGLLILALAHVAVKGLGKK